MEQLRPGCFPLLYDKSWSLFLAWTQAESLLGMSLESSTVTVATSRFNPAQSSAHSPSCRMEETGEGVKCSNSWAEMRMWHPLWNLGCSLHWRTGKANASPWWKQTQILEEAETRHLKWQQEHALYRCKIFLFVNADLLNLFPQIPKPITLCILQKILFLCCFRIFFANIRYYYTEQKKL